MGEVITYPGAIPLAADLLNAQQNAGIVAGYLSEFVFGTETVLNGLNCTPALTGIGVSVDRGAIIQAGVVDQTGLGVTLAADMRELMKIGINLDPTPFNLVAPTVPGTAINYLIECMWGVVDDTALVKSYYNAANPSQPLSGPGGMGAAQNTARHQFIEMQMRAGAPAVVGSQSTPAVDAGWVGIWIVTVRAGVTGIIQSDIQMYPNAPFVRTKLQHLASLSNTALTGNPTAPTPAAGDNSTSIATTAFVYETAVVGVEAEAAVRLAADNAEAAARAAEDGTLQAEITAEANARAAEDGTLQAEITAEIAAREAADSNIEVWANATFTTAAVAAADAAAAANAVLASLFSTTSDVTGSRSFGPWYTNSTGRPMFVTVNGSTPTNSLEAMVLTLSTGMQYVGSATSGYFGTSGGIIACGIIPAGVSYQATISDGGASLSFWTETV